MFSDWFILLLLLVVSARSFLPSKRPPDLLTFSKLHFYWKDAVSGAALCVFIFMVNPLAYWPLNFEALGTGVLPSAEIVSSIVPVFLVPLFLAFTPWGAYPKDIHTATNVFGLPVHLLPDHYREWTVFALVFIAGGVLLEELIFRQVAFYAVHATLGLRGDYLLVCTALLFASGHWYQGVPGLFSSFWAGLILGKLYQYSGTLWYPVALHMGINMTVVALAAQHIRDLG